MVQINNYIMKYLFLAFALSFSTLSAQDTIRNQIFIEAGGQGGFYSINYERFLSNRITLRVGFSSWSLDIMSGSKNFLVPVTLNHIIGEAPHQFEIGIGMTYFRQNDELEGKTTQFNYTGALCYRYQSKEQGGPIFRIGFVPSIVPKFKEVWPLPAISIGIGF